jgi:hypothetical protein
MAKKLSIGDGHRAKRLRCAIYTRKSSEEGLEQDFNSLDAQREACEAFIASQRHEGWIALPEMYDDGGFSGATIERPAFQRLLTDVSEGKIDVVVVYKVDRLTRSLSMRRGLSARPARPRTALDMAQSRSRAGRFTSCCRIGSIAARSCTRK